MQVARGENLGERSLGRVSDEPEAVRIEQRILLEQVRGVIAIMKCDIQPTPDDAVAHDDAKDVGRSPQESVGQLEESVQSAKAVERSGDEGDHARLARDRPPGD